MGFYLCGIWIKIGFFNAKTKRESKIMKILPVTLLCLSLAVSGCVVTPMDDAQPTVKVVSSDMVTHCQSVGNISSSSTAPYGFFKERANESIVDLAKREGTKLGATHIVLSTPVAIDDTITINGKAYLCN